MGWASAPLVLGATGGLGGLAVLGLVDWMTGRSKCLVVKIFTRLGLMVMTWCLLAWLNLVSRFVVGVAEILGVVCL